ncbi:MULTISPECIES: hypothetical protein [Saccharopolyspora]|uniref:hypothetical protein n=1 Tax=Saccharopolyspora TaxID=1835 RepID=UPI001CD81874|nr:MULTISPECIES: hypothetical protein [Saccharopolyspora]MCA1187997.1 hypothetical protein [Saccharopolyspora sp. 6T]MCA1229701.1 hypothetical protein [Saccharopolyspora sp. 6M]MCA1283097.1 hypothetical protein [Saccharopolyspora sp. 7B]
MAGYDGMLWRTLHRVLLVLAVGVLGLLLGLGHEPSRADSLFGVLVVALVALPVWITFQRMTPVARGNLRALPRHRPLMTAMIGLLGLVALFVLGWTIANALFPGTLAPLALALVGVVLAALVALLNRVL